MLIGLDSSMASPPNSATSDSTMISAATGCGRRARNRTRSTGRNTRFRMKASRIGRTISAAA